MLEPVPKDITETLSAIPQISTYGGRSSTISSSSWVREDLPRAGARADRRELQRFVKDLAAGDVATVTRIHRLARSTFDLFAVVRAIVDAGGQLPSRAQPWADTTTKARRLMSAVLGGLADVEHGLMCTRTAEGRNRVRGRGQHMRRPPSFTAAQQQEARQRRADGAP